MKDPHFERSVVLMIEHDNNEGSLGIIVNRPTDLRLGQIFKDMDLSTSKFENNEESPVVLEGGPVAPQLGWIIHSLDWTSSESNIIKKEAAVTASLDILKSISVDKGPSSYLFCLGYSGWGPGQLVNEIKTGAWLNVPFDASLLFDVPVKDRWQAAIASLGIDPLNLSAVIGDA